MSAYIVDKTHIDLLVDTAISGPSNITVEPGFWDGLRWWTKPLLYVAKEAREAYQEGGYEAYSRIYQDYRRDTHHTDPDALGRLLWTENLCSVAARYPNDESGTRPGTGDSDDDQTARLPADRPGSARRDQLSQLPVLRARRLAGKRGVPVPLAFTGALVGKIADGWEWDEEELAKAKQRKLVRG